MFSFWWILHACQVCRRQCRQPTTPLSYPSELPSFRLTWVNYHCHSQIQRVEPCLSCSFSVTPHGFVPPPLWKLSLIQLKCALLKTVKHYRPLPQCTVPVLSSAMQPGLPWRWQVWQVLSPSLSSSKSCILMLSALCSCLLRHRRVGLMCNLSPRLLQKTPVAVWED